MLKKFFLLALIFLLPLIFDPHLEDFALIKIIFLRLGTLVLIFFPLAEIFKKGFFLWKATPINRLLFLLIILLLAASFGSIHPATSFFDSYIIHDGFFLNLNYLVLFFLALIFFNQDETPQIAGTIFWAGVGVALFGLLEFLKIPFFTWGLPSPWGIYSTVGFHNFSGAYLAMALLLGIGLYWQTSQKFTRYLLTAGLTLIFVALILTESFSAWFGFGVGFLFLGYSLIRQQKFSFKNAFSFLMLFLVLFLLLMPLESAKMPLARQIYRLKIDWTLRVETWKATLKMMRDFPFLGIGPDTFELVYPRYQSEKFAILSGGQTITHRAHNEFLDVAVSSGIPALLIYLLILFLIFKQGFRQAKVGSVLSAAIFSALTSYLAQNLVSFGEVSITSTFWVLTACLFLEAPRQKINWPGFLKKPAVFFLIYLFLTLWITFKSGCFYLADRYFVVAEGALKKENFSQAIIYYKKASFFNPIRTEYFLHEAYTYLKVAEKLPVQHREAFLKEALAILDRAIKINPHQYVSYYLEGLVLKKFDELEQKEKAKNYFIEALRLNPYRPEILECIRFSSPKSSK